MLTSRHGQCGRVMNYMILRNRSHFRAAVSQSCRPRRSWSVMSELSSHSLYPHMSADVNDRWGYSQSDDHGLKESVCLSISWLNSIVYSAVTTRREWRDVMTSWRLTLSSRQRCSTITHVIGDVIACPFYWTFPQRRSREQELIGAEVAVKRRSQNWKSSFAIKMVAICNK